MFTRPDELSDADVAAELESAWGLEVTELEYAPVGFGSHHWHTVADGRRWFATVDDLRTKRRATAEPVALARRRLAAALSTARRLADHGHEYVVAPLPALDGAAVGSLSERFTIALYPHVEGRTSAFGAYPDRGERLGVLDLLTRLHHAPVACRADVAAEDFEIPLRDDLELALGDRSGRWSWGPFSEPARALLSEHRVAVETVLGRYDRLAGGQRSRRDRMVITHGEPHRGNTISTDDSIVLIDWDTCLLAPPERDLWSLIGEDPEIAGAYADRTGTRVDPVVIELYSLAWDLTETAIYVSDFRRPHDENDDTRTAWAGLQQHLDPARWQIG